MNFDNATLLSASRASQFLGDNTNYKTVLSLEIEGLLLDLENTQGVDGILTQVSSMVESSDNWTDIIINGYNYGKGIVNSIDFEGGNDVKEKKYKVSISIPKESTNLNYFKNGSYSGLTYDNFQYIEGFSESSNYSRSIKRENYDQSISFSVKCPEDQNANNIAKDLADSFFKNNSLQDFLGEKYSDSIINRKFHTESYDDVNNKYTFSRNYEISKDSGENQDAYSIYRTHELSFDASGVISVSERSEYVCHSDDGFDVMCIDAASDINNHQQAINRCTELIVPYLGNSTREELQLRPISQSSAVLSAEKKITHDLRFTNSNRIKQEESFGYFLDRKINVNRSIANNYSVDDSYTIVGFGSIIENKWSNALLAWEQISADGGLAMPDGILPSNITLKDISVSTTFQKVKGTISYSRKQNDSDSIIDSNVPIRKEVITISNEYNRNLATAFSIINHKEILQKQKNLLPNSLVYTINLNGAYNTSLQTYLDHAKSLIPNKPIDSYVSDASYSYDIFNRSFVLNVTITRLPEVQGVT